MGREHPPGGGAGVEGAGRVQARRPLQILRRPRPVRRPGRRGPAGLHRFATPGLIDDADIPGILEVADVAESWIRDVRAYARNQALRGQQWAGFKLVRGRKGNRAWKDEEAVREQLIRAGYTEEQYAVHKLRPPGEIEKELGKQAFSALVAKYVTQADGALNLVPESDKRIEFAAADADFSDMAGSAEDRPAGEFGTE